VSAFERVETERLILRRPVPGDLGAHHRIHADPRSWTHAPDLRHRDVAESERQLLHWLAHWARRGYGYWSVEREGRVIGFGGLMLLEGWRDGEDVLNLYYRVEPESWGHGYATEASRAALDLAARELPDLLVVARIRPTNVESIRVAERVGLCRRPDLDDAEFLVHATR
jgi:ribosomal-protein-alanine N-acetyltransferase